MINRYTPEGTRISTLENREHISSKEGLAKALEKQLILEAPAILCDHNFNLHVSLGGGISGIIPREECEFIQKNAEIKDIAILTRVGKPVCFKVTGFKRDDNGEVIAMLSRKSAQRECVLNYISTLIPGDIIPARVTHLENFGAFVDIGCGIISLLSIDCISVSRIAHPSARLGVGDSMFAVVKSIDERGRVYVTERELLGSWEENVYPEQTAAVYIKSIIPDKMKVKLIIIDTVDDPPVREPLEYFIDPDETSHIDLWTYSPRGSKKVIESQFL